MMRKSELTVPTGDQGWRFHHFGLIVTGKTEEKCLPKLFRSLAATRKCTFKVIRRIDQLDPIRSHRRRLEMVVSGKTIPNKDEQDIGFPARRFLSSETDFVTLVDDLEASRAGEITQVFDRYRLALDTILRDQAHRASVHFLVNMLEAYYFADAQAVNGVLGTQIEDYEGDVETIRHPKGRLKQLHRGFDEVEHGCQILDKLRAAHVLSRRETCASLRTMFAWICRIIGETEGEVYQLSEGRYSDVTGDQPLTLAS